ncbi:MAG: DHH family phosphoesterase [Deltaproteobacteria bacterium]|nr:DHH family phosphoesterase [Deltaproteobacteria bacterium]
MKKTQLVKLHSLLIEVKSFALVGHVSPDPDCIGSCLAFKKFLEFYGKKRTFFVSATGSKSKWFEKIAPRLRPLPAIPTKCETVIILDCADLSRVDAKDFKVSQKTVVNVDHHISNTGYGDISIVDARRSSTCEILFDIFCTLRPEKDWLKNISKYLALGIIFDTNNFRNQGVSERVFNIMAKLSKHIHIQRLIKVLTEIKFYSLQEFCRGFLRGKTIMDGKGFIQFVNSDTESDWYSDFLGLVKEIDITCVAKRRSNFWQCSLRSKKHDVNKLARQFGGGGHKRASAFKFVGSRTKLIQALESGLKKAINKSLEKKSLIPKS